MKEGRMKGQAFVTLAREEQAVQAVRDTNAFLFKGKPMAVVRTSHGSLFVC
jgi:RNA recognition motif-containing protein